MTSTRHGARMAANSLALWRFPVASTKRTRLLQPGDRSRLGGGEIGRAGRREVEHGGKRLARVRLALGGRLHLDEPAVAGDHRVEVDRGGRVLLVVEVEPRLAVDDARGDGGDGVEQ